MRVRGRKATVDNMMGMTATLRNMKDVDRLTPLAWLHCNNNANRQSAQHLHPNPLLYHPSNTMTIGYAAPDSTAITM